MFSMLDSGLPDTNAKKIEYCPIHHICTLGTCDLCVDDGVEDFSVLRAQKELDKLENEVADMPEDLGCVEYMRTESIKVISRLKQIVNGG
jgi:hypothetical protein